MTDQVKLFGTWASPFSRRVELALKFKGVPYEYFEENLGNKSPELLMYNPIHKKIPVLVHNGKPVAESLVIIEYIDEIWKNNPLMPEDPFERARVRFLATFLDDKILMTLYRKGFLRDDEEREQGIEETHENLAYLEKELEGKEFLGGEKIGFLDIVAFAAIHWVVILQGIMERPDVICREKFPAVNRWIEKFDAIDVVKECTPPVEKHMGYLKARREFLRSSQ